MIWLFEKLHLVHLFIAGGGPVLWWIAILLMVLWALIVERLYYLLVLFPHYHKRLVTAWMNRMDKQSWCALQIRQTWLAQAEMKLKQNMAFLNVLIKMFPLLGLLGTVSGMVQVFDVVAVYGTGNPRLLASGISLATIPTMAGLVCALSGLFIYSRLESRRKLLLSGLALQLANDNDCKEVIR